ncbi:YdcF family protein [Olivibacter sitiensis]|uniref:YdcF family protein n=1 Tax=Olivibacter sitiensis TaxID=376470 RepID=UPI00056778E5|nr:YdcF family protein [Olivibacter sitiensis]
MILIKYFKITITLATLGICTLHMSWAQDYSAYKSPQDWIIAKNYYLTFLLAQKDAPMERILSNAKIDAILQQRNLRYKNSIKCADLTCFLDAFKWKQEEIDPLTELLADAAIQDTLLTDLIHQQLIPSMAYGAKIDETPREYFAKAIRQDMMAMNYVIDVYGGGEKPNYPKIDSISFDVTNGAYLMLLQDVRQDVTKDIQKPTDAFYASLLTAVRLLEVNERWDAAQLEPLIAMENRKAYEKIQQTDFDAYPYSLLLTLGAGPTVYGQPISPGGMLRSRMAARSYFDGLAPFIVVSGGRVHPYKTPYIEAVEMKKYLTEVLGVPDDAILIDPHARHTTTNMRNTARIMLNYGFPKDKYAIVNSSVPHIDAVEKMADRCIRELGYVPYELGKRISDVIIEFKPKKEALTIDPDEPLDP